MARDWGLALGPALGGATRGLVQAVTLADGTSAVLKLGKPGQGVAAQAAALAAWGGAGAARLLRADPARGALLLERLSPGTPLAALCAAGEDERASAVLAGLMQRLHRPPPALPLARAAGWWRAIAACRDPRLDPGQRDRALGLWRELAADAPPPVLLHGDLHHGNVLADGAGWRAVDPYAVVGEAAFDAAAALTEPAAWLARRRDAAAILARRLALFAERVGLPADRLAAWGFAIAVLKTVWAIEDEAGEAVQERAAVAALVAPMLR